MKTGLSDTKQLAAAMAAVEMYLQEEAAVVQGAMVPGVLEPPAATASAPVNLWGLNGRQTQMQNRQLMQMRTFKN